ncbi:MAG: GYD domain-containing protein [Anaerolineales bacterium]|nr:GYD domain-containing protein [Anaerolineales bacterium]
MSAYVLMGKYSQDALKKISARRTAGAAAVIRKNGGELKAGYALLGEVDVVLIADFPDNAKAMKASIELTRLLGIGFRTAPAVSVEYFDTMMA